MISWLLKLGNTGDASSKGFIHVPYTSVNGWQQIHFKDQNPCPNFKQEGRERIYKAAVAGGAVMGEGNLLQGGG